MSRVLFAKTLWGMEGELGAKLERIAEARYAAFENPLFDTPAGDHAGLDYCAQAFPDSVDGVRAAYEDAHRLGAKTLTLQAGRDWWDEDRAAAFFEGALELERPCVVGFETHRGKLLFTPASTLRMLHRFPGLPLTADLSHWTCVCESDLADQSEALDAAIRATVILHARVGHAEGPQVPDPRWTRFAPWLARFERWWDRIVAARPEGEAFYVDPEFGPPDYAWTGADDAPLADAFEVSTWLRDRLAARWTGNSGSIS